MGGSLMEPKQIAEEKNEKQFMRPTLRQIFNFVIVGALQTFSSDSAV